MPARRLSRRELLEYATAAVGVLACSRAGCRAEPAAQAFSELRDELEGELVLPSSPGYERLRRTSSFNPLTDQGPAAIARCASAADVARSVVFAAERDLEIAVRSGGHDILGASVCEGGLVVDLSPMRQIEVDPRARTLRCGPGLRAGDVNRETQPFGLAAALGCNPVVGIGGLRSEAASAGSLERTAQPATA